MPFSIMAINALICGILCMTLPETNKLAMPDTVEQLQKDEVFIPVDGDNEKLNPNEY